MTTRSTIVALDADTLAALREADSLTFHVYDGQGSIRAYREKRGEIYTAREQRLFPTPREYGGRYREVPCEYGAAGYGKSVGIAWNTDTAPDLSAYASVSGADYCDGTWPTTAAALRVGDRVFLSWLADNNSEVIRAAGLHSDRLTLRVTRGEGGKEKRLAFHVDDSTTPDNSARMIRRDGRR